MTTQLASPPPALGSGLARPLRRLGVALALLLPVLGEVGMRLASTEQRGRVAVGYFVACLLFAVLAPRCAPEPAAPTGRQLTRSGGLLAAAALLTAAAGVYLAWGNPRGWVLVPLWLLGLALWAAAWVRPRRAAGPWPGGAWAALAVLLVAAGLRLVELPQLQPIQIDEMVMVEGALRRGDDRPFGPQGLPLFAPVQGDGFSQLRHTEYRRLLMFEIGGINLLALRLPTTALGILEIGLLYLLGRQLFGVRVGLIAAAVATTLTAHLSMSRHGSDYLEGSLAWTVTALLLARGLARRSVGWLALAGVVLAHVLYIYMSFRPAPIFAVALLAVCALDPATRGRWLLGGALALLGGFLVGSGPMLAAYLKNPGIYLYRPDQAGWIGTAVGAYRASGDPAKLWPLWEHLRTALLGYNLIGSNDNHYLPGRGLFLLFPAGLMFAGLAAATLRLLRWRYALLALWFWAITLGLSALSDATPPGHRILPVIPPAALLIGLALDGLATAWGRFGGPIGRLAQAALAAALAVFLVLEGAFYFGDYAHRDFDRWQDHLVRATLAAPDGHHFGVVPGQSPYGMELHVDGKPFQWASDLHRRVTGENVGRLVDQVPALGGQRNGATYLVHSGVPWWIEPIRQAYPSGQPGALYSRDGRLADPLAWLTHRVDAAAVAERLGLELTAVDARGATVRRRVDAVDVAAATLPAAYPVRLEWRGWLRLPPRGGETIAFAAAGSSGATVHIGDLRLAVPAGETRTAPRLPPGGLPLLVTAELGSPADTLVLTWNGARPGATTPFPAGVAVTWPGPPRVLLEWLSADGRRSMRRDYDVMIADRNLGLRRPPDGPHLLRWSGTLAITEPGPYELDVRSDGPVRLVVDDRQVWPRGGEAAAAINLPPEARWFRVDLTPGEHRLVVERHRFEGGELTLLWRRRGGPEAIVPIEAFTPLAWP